MIGFVLRMFHPDSLIVYLMKLAAWCILFSSLGVGSYLVWVEMKDYRSARDITLKMDDEFFKVTNHGKQYESKLREYRSKAQRTVWD